MPNVIPLKGWCSLWNCRKPLGNTIVTVAVAERFDDGFSRGPSKKYCSKLCASQDLCPEDTAA